jgi:Glyoxalase/Bleomycin resistance protein/Dioxygenase superfamily
MAPFPLLQMIDAVTVAVPDLDSGLRCYRDCLGHELLWRNNDIGLDSTCWAPDV